MRFVRNVKIGEKMDEYVNNLNCILDKEPQTFIQRSLAAEYFQINYDNSTLWDFNKIVELTKV